MGEDEKKIRATVKWRCKLPNTVAKNDQDDPRKDGVEENIGNMSHCVSKKHELKDTISQKVGIASNNANEPLHQVRNHIHTHGDANGVSAKRVSDPVRSEIDASEHRGKGNEKRQWVGGERVHDTADHSCLRHTPFQAQPAHCRRRGRRDLRHPFAEEQRVSRWCLRQDVPDQIDTSVAP